ESRTHQSAPPRCRSGLTSVNRCGIRDRPGAPPRQTVEPDSAAPETPDACSRPVAVEEAGPKTAEFPFSARFLPQALRRLVCAPTVPRGRRAHEPANARIAGRYLGNSRSVPMAKEPFTIWEAHRTCTLLFFIDTPKCPCGYLFCV